MASTVLNEGLTYKELFPLALHALLKGYSVFIKGKPGCGKSTMARELAVEIRKIRGKEQGREVAFPFIDLRPSQMEPSELAGLPYPDKDTGRVIQFLPAWFPSEAAFICIEEFNAAVTKLHQAVMFQLVWDKRIGPHSLTEGSVVLALGNPEEDNIIVSPIAAPLNNRFVHFTLRPDVDGWLEWAEEQGLPSDYRGYIAFMRDEALYKNTGEDAFPTPRSNEMAARINGVPDATKKRRLVAGCIGDAYAAKYMAFVEVYKDINTRTIFEKGEIPQITVRSEPSFLYALMYASVNYLSGLTPAKVKGKVAETAVRLLSTYKVHPEYQTTFIKLLVSRKAKMLDALRGVPEFGEIAPKIADMMAAATEPVG
jgi:hypothetical protein